MIRVAMLSSVNESLDKITSGVPKATVELVRALKTYCPDISVDIISLNSTVSKVTEHKTEIGTIYWLPTWRHGRSATLYVFDILRILKFIKKGRYQLVHSHAFPELILAGEFSGLPHIVTIHGIIGKEAKKNGKRILSTIRETVRGVIEKWYMARINYLISISRYVETQLPKNSHAHIENIDNAINESFFNLKLPTSSNRILQVGVVTYRKGAHLLLEAAALLKEANLNFSIHLVGATPDVNYLRSLKSFIKENELESYVHIHGTVNDDELKIQYSLANVICLTSFEETSPLSLSQGMAAGKIVIGSDAAGIPYLIEDGHNGRLFQSGDPKHLSIVIREILMGKSNNTQMSENAKSTALEKFHPQNVAKKTLAIYESLLKEIR